MYAKVENYQVTQIGLPTTGILADGSTVSGYDLLPESILLAEGWLPLVDNRPEYDPGTEYLEHAGYTVGETEVTANYTVKDIVPVEPTLGLSERVAELEADNLLLGQEITDRELEAIEQGQYITDLELRLLALEVLQ